MAEELGQNPQTSLKKSLVKVPVVFCPYAISHPRAMMIHSEYAHVTLGAVMRTWRPEILAPLAV
jgi:hypothetical protein